MTVNINGLSSPSKRESLSDCVKSKIHLCVAYKKWTVKKEKKEGREKKSRWMKLGKYLSNAQSKLKGSKNWQHFKVEFRIKIMWDKEGYFILIKGSFYNKALRCTVS